MTTLPESIVIGKKGQTYMRLIRYLPLLALPILGCGADVLPVLPAKGWVKKGDAWYQSNIEICDFNADGRIDYVRVQDPPDSFNHRVWIDSDHDGFFDRYTDNNGEKTIHIRVPPLQPQ